MKPSVGDVSEVIDALVPRDLAEDWDNVGLQVGESGETVSCLGISLDASPASLAEADRLGVDMLVVHHPLIFRPRTNITASDRVGQLLLDMIRRGISLYCAHTNLDYSDLGPSAALGRRLNLRDVVPVVPSADLVKIAAFVPEDSLEVLRRALGDAGAGNIGAYSHCTFSAPGEGTFRPSESTSPYIGKRGEVNRVSEYRVETVAPRNRLGAVLSALLRAHPYEEPAYDVYPLENARDVGAGRIGNLPEATSAEDLADHLRRLSGCRGLRLLGDPGERIDRVAVASGSGSGIWRSVLGMGGDVLLTGDLDYHSAEDIMAAGLVAIDMGHAGSEAPFLGDFSSAIRDELCSRGYDCRVVELTPTLDPWVCL